ncbi:MAG: prolyl oligopeptidase family serine peptidase [Pseudomonadota bacterium]
MNTTHVLAAASVAMMLAACGGGGSDSGGVSTTDNSVTRGSLQFNPPLRVTALTAADFTARLNGSTSGQQLLAVAGVPKCGVNFHYIQYGTVGGQGEPATASGALMVPTGTDPACTGARPIVLYAHGTTTDRGYNIANILDASLPGASEGSLVGALYAAQGFTVVAPNYVGYDASSSSYHPFLNGDQQSKDMIDALTAARKALPAVGAIDSGKLLVTGYSEGGYVALATQRALQAAGQPVTAVAPLSAPSAISLLVDYASFGAPALGGTVFTPLLSTSWQKQFGTVYTTPGDMYEAQYATGIETLLPSLLPVNTLFATGRLPSQALWPANAVPGPATPQFAPFYGANNLLKQTFLTATVTDATVNACPGNAFPATTASRSTTTPLACAPAQGFRKAAVANDLRNYVPLRPVFFCGGANDPTVNFESTRSTAGYFGARGVPATALTVLDLETAATGATDPFAAAKGGFAQAKASVAASAGANATAQATAVATAYHGTLVPPFCNAAARGFFQQVLAAGI